MARSTASSEHTTTSEVRSSAATTTPRPTAASWARRSIDGWPRPRPTPVTSEGQATPSRRNVSWSARAAPSRGMWRSTTARELMRVMTQRKAPGEPERVAVPRRLERRGVDTVGSQLSQVVPQQVGLAGSPGLNVEDGAEVVGGVDAVAALGDPVQPAHVPVCVEVGVAGVGVAVEHARRRPRRFDASPPGASAGVAQVRREIWAAAVVEETLERVGGEERRHLVDARGEPLNVPLLVAPRAHVEQRELGRHVPAGRHRTGVDHRPRK